MFKKFLLLLLLVIPTFAYCGKKPTPGYVDHRIKTVIYDSRNVIEIIGHYGFATHIVFSDSEVIQHIAAGDSLAWQIIPNGHHLFVKPSEERADTNITVITNKRTYNFDLKAHRNRRRRAKDLTYEINFKYPEDELKLALFNSKKYIRKQQKQKAIKIENKQKFDVIDANWSYTRRGSEELAPLRVFDNGEFTFFQFNESKNIPAIFIVNTDKSESIVNFHKRGPYYVVQRIAGQFALRDTGVVTCIYNENWSTASDSIMPEDGVDIMPNAGGDNG
jgi:type IV secretion system protein VirB9